MSKRNIINEEKLCSSLGGVDVPLLTITSILIKKIF